MVYWKYYYKFLKGFYFCEFRELNHKGENKYSQNIFPSFISEQKVCTTNDTQVSHCTECACKAIKF